MAKAKSTKAVIKITPDIIIDLYLESKKLPAAQQAKALEKIKILSQNLYKEAIIDF